MLYTLRIILVTLWFFIGSGILFFVFLLRPFHLKNALIWCHIVPPIGRRILNLKYEIRNHERMKENHPCVYVANHQHALDLLIFAETLITPTSAIGKKELKWIPFYGWIFWLSGQIMIDRKNRSKAIHAMDEAADMAIQKNASLWIFPEGTRRQDFEMGPFKKGAFHLSLQMNRPIVPLVCNTFHKTLNFNKWNPGQIIIQVLEPISPTNYNSENIDLYANETRLKMQAEIQKLNLEMQPQL